MTAPAPVSIRSPEDDAHQLAVINSILNQFLGAAADRRLLRRLRPLLLASFKAAAEDIAADLGIEATVGIAHPIAVGYIENRVPQLVGVNTFTRLRIRQILAEEIAKGSPLGRQITRLRREFRIFRRGRPGGVRGASRARTVARTENGIAWSVGRHQQMLEASVMAESWITARDPRVRSSHLTMEGQCRPIEEPFTTGAGHLLMHPLDPAGPAEEVINCRCTTLPVPRGCEAPRALTYRQRTRYWRGQMAAQRPHELAVARGLRAEWVRQENDIADAMRAAA